MNKTRYRLTLATLALAASPIALVAFMFTAYFHSVIENPKIFGLENFMGFLGPIVIVNWLPAAYVFGLFPTVYALLAIHKSTRPEGKLRVRRIFLVSLMLAVLPWLALTLATGRIQSLVFVFTAAIAASVAFFILLPIGKKLLGWSGALLIQPTKTGTP